MIKTIAFGIGVVVVALLAVAIASSHAATVVIYPGSLNLEEVTINKGEEVTWINASNSLADIEGIPGLSGSIHGSATVKFDHPGTYPYTVRCWGGGEAAGQERGVIVIR